MIRERLLEEINNRLNYGEEFYPTTLLEAAGEEGMLTWLNKALEESIDAAIYLMTIIHAVEAETSGGFYTEEDIQHDPR